MYDFIKLIILIFRSSDQTRSVETGASLAHIRAKCCRRLRHCGKDSRNHDHLFERKLNTGFWRHFFPTNQRHKIVPPNAQNEWNKCFYFLNSGDAIPIGNPVQILPSLESPPSQSSEDEDQLSVSELRTLLRKARNWFSLTSICYIKVCITEFLFWKIVILICPVRHAI